MPYNRIAIFAILIFCATTAFSQPFERLVSYRLHYHLPSDYKHPENAGAEKFALLQHTVDILLPIPIKIKKRESHLIAGAFYNNFQFSSKTGGAEIASQSYDRLTFKLGLTHQWGHPKHKTLLMGLPTFSTDGKIFSPDAFQMGGVFIHSYVVNDNLTLKLGLYYNHEFFGNFFMPLLGIDWRLNNDWYIFGVLPGTFNAYKKVNEWFAFSFTERAPTGSLLATRSDGDFVRYGEGAYVILAGNLHFSPFRFDFSGNNADVTFNVSLGHTLFRTYDLFLFGNDKIESGPFYEMKDGLYLQVGIEMRVWQ